MNPLLLVMNPRRIARCLAAIEALAIDKAWMVAFWEKHLEAVVDELVETLPEYTHFVLLSDDTVPTQGALDRVLSALRDGHEVVTGYCNLDMRSPFVNLTRSPFKRRDMSLADDYAWMTRAEVEAWPFPIVPSFFAGACLTGMSRAMWQRFPFRCNTHDGEPRGYSSDWNLCVRLQDARIPIVAPRDAFVLHLKEEWTSQRITDPERRLLVGVIPSEVRLERSAS